MEKKMVWLLLGNYEDCKWLFLFIPIHFLFLLLLLLKLHMNEGMAEGNETGILLNSIFILGIYDYFMVTSFPESVKIAMVHNRGITRISGIIFTNCKSFVWGI